MDNMQKQLAELQRSIDLVGSDIHDIRKEQTRSAESHKKLHEEHVKLVERIDHHERRLEVHINDYQRQQEHNALVHAHMTAATLAVGTELKEFREDFNADRKQQISRLQTTLLSVLGTGAVLLVAILTLAFDVWGR
jgi:hypothetical protein